MNRQRKDRIRVGFMMAISVAVIVSALLLGAMDGTWNDPWMLFVMIVMICIAAVVLFIAARAMFSEIGRGIPLQDERSKRVVEKASAISFIVMIYLLLAIGFFSDHSSYELLPTDVTALGILGGAISFAVCWAIYNRSAKLE